MTQNPAPPVMIIVVEFKIENAVQDARYLFLDKIYKN